MGTIVYVVCRDCKVKRDLDKFYPCFMECKSVDQAKKVQSRVESAHAYRAGLLATFMSEHFNHSCTLSYDTCMSDEVREMPEDYDFWSSDQ